MEKDRIVGKNVIEGRRTDGNRQRRTETDRDGQRMFKNKIYVTGAQGEEAESTGITSTNCL